VLSPGARRADTLPVSFTDDETTPSQIIPATEYMSSSRFFPHYMPRRPTNEILHGNNVIRNNSQDPSLDDLYASPIEWQEPHIVTNSDNIPLDRSGQQPLYILNSRGLLFPINSPANNSGALFSYFGRPGKYERSQRRSMNSGSESDNEIRRNSSPPSETLLPRHKLILITIALRIVLAKIASTSEKDQSEAFKLRA